MKRSRAAVGDPVFEHMAVNLLPHAVAFLRNLTAKDFRVKNVRGFDAVNIAQIVADVAEGLAIERYGKPRFRVPAGREVASCAYGEG